jgi:UDP:flavonoid glycosyltransferase YjiC (YdhE family)
VVSNVDAGRASLLAEFPNTYFSAQYLPMHYVCANVDLVFHHCGSGAYHYPLLHGVFSITIGTQKYDREDVALELEQLGIARYIPSPLENQGFLKAFRACVDQYVIHGDYDRAMVRTKLGRLQEEIARTQKEFNFMQVLETVRSLLPRTSH